jgi:hypothetical protein
MYTDLRALEGREFVCGDLSIADLALFPHMTAVRFLDVPIDGGRHPRLLAWYKRMRALDICRADLSRAQEWLARVMPSTPRPERIVWRGDRIEWLLAAGYTSGSSARSAARGSPAAGQVGAAAQARVNRRQAGLTPPSRAVILPIPAYRPLPRRPIAHIM